MILRPLAILALLALAGCTTVTRSFPGQSPEKVWTTAVGLAQSPDYSSDDPMERWTVVVNDVWIEEETNRIEIYREIKRDLHRPLTSPLRQERDWRFRITLDPREGDAPPRVSFMSQGWGVPSQARDEANRFFDDMQAILGSPAQADPTLDDWFETLGPEPGHPTRPVRMYDD